MFVICHMTIKFTISNINKLFMFLVRNIEIAYSLIFKSGWY